MQVVRLASASASRRPGPLVAGPTVSVRPISSHSWHRPDFPVSGRPPSQRNASRSVGLVCAFVWWHACSGGCFWRAAHRWPWKCAPRVLPAAKDRER